MTTLLIAVFIVTYIAIALEHPIRINKAATAIIGAGILWTLYALMGTHVNEGLSESLSATAQVVFFLMGAMAIVEVIDSHDGFAAITARIKPSTMPSLLWIIGTLSFFLSAILDNLTTTIVMISLARKLLAHREDRIFFAAIIVIAANAGGAWSPIGDVTTTMLWIGGQITSLNIIQSLFLPSLINLLIPLTIVSFSLKGKPIIAPAPDAQESDEPASTPFERTVILVTGLGILCAVPIFKAVTHLPPFMGILFGLGILWLVGDLIHRNKPHEQSKHLTLAAALQRIDLPSLIFFTGILLSVATLEHTHVLTAMAHWLEKTLSSQSIIIFTLGLLSAVIDNVPLVAASIGMYPLSAHPTDSFLWEFLAYAAGTGGSLLIIGSAAGVAAMGLEKIEFLWYMRKVSLLALAGYIGGCACYVLFQ